MNVSPWGAVPPMPPLVDVGDVIAAGVVLVILAACVVSRVKR